MTGEEPPVSGSEPPLRTTGLTKTYREPRLFRRPRTVEALTDMGLSLAPGEAFGLVGPNGAGKSTAIKLFTGLIFPSRGTVALNGLPPSQPESRRGLGVVPEDPSLYLHLTPEETLYSAARLHGLDHPTARARTRELLDRLGLSDVARTLLRKHSKGMAQRVAVGQALAGDPHLLILDEPLTGLDPVWRHRVVEILADFRDAGGTLLFSSHILADVERLADRIGILHRGVVRAVTTPAELIGRHVAAYVVRTRGPQPPSGVEAHREGPEQWTMEVAEPELWSVLEELRERGHQIVEIRPAGAGLEGAVMHFLQETKASA